MAHRSVWLDYGRTGAIRTQENGNEPFPGRFIDCNCWHKIRWGVSPEYEMARSLKLQVVERARALIADQRHWCRGDLARDVNGVAVCPTAADAVKRCGLGAVMAAAYDLTHDSNAARDFAFRALRPCYGTTTLVQINDLRGHAAVLALFDEVIAAENA